jgi:y4mF family transcriptional regulator
MTTKQIGKTVTFLRKQARLTQKQLADLAGVGKTVVFDVEKGKETVQLNSLLKVFSILNIKLELSNPIIHLMEKSDEES